MRRETKPFPAAVVWQPRIWSLPRIALTVVRRREKPLVPQWGFFGVYADPRAWGGPVSMLISLIVGIPVTTLLLLAVRGLIFLEGRLVEALLGSCPQLGRAGRRPAPMR